MANVRFLPIARNWVTLEPQVAHRRGKSIFIAPSLSEQPSVLPASKNLPGKTRDPQQTNNGWDEIERNHFSCFRCNQKLGLDAKNLETSFSKILIGYHNDGRVRKKIWLRISLTGMAYAPSHRVDSLYLLLEKTCRL